LKPPKLLRTGILAMALAAVGLGPGAGTARAAVITLDVSGSMMVAGPGGACPAVGCTLGGDIEINNSTGAIVSEDVTMAGETPTVGPFTINSGIFAPLGLTLLDILDPAGDFLQLFFSTPTAGSLVGYTGGPLSTDTFVGTPTAAHLGSDLGLAHPAGRRSRAVLVAASGHGAGGHLRPPPRQTLAVAANRVALARTPFLGAHNVFRDRFRERPSSEIQMMAEMLA
jgi:hypothetical protein